jgi:hypothetical protein
MWVGGGADVRDFFRDAVRQLRTQRALRNRP